MRHGVYVITGTDTGVGKTVVACWLTAWARARGRKVMALKPVASGGREDARALRAVLGEAVSLDVVNPWHFRRPLAPLLAARLEGRRVRKGAVLAWVRRLRRRHEVLVVEGAGGLLSPLGEGWSTRDLVACLRAVPVVVCPNRLGAVNQVRLVLAALPRGAARQAVVVLNAAGRADASAFANAELLEEFLGKGRVCLFPRVREAASVEGVQRHAEVERALRGCLG